MSDISRFYYDGFPILLISMFDPLTNQILYYQVILFILYTQKTPTLNYYWSISKLFTQFKILLNTTFQNGFTLYNNFTDYSLTKEIKVTSQKVGKLLLLFFYNSSFDFYYIAPFIYNLIRGIQFVLKTNNISANKVRRQYIDINTMISDTISLFNCNTRIKYNDYSYFLGNDAIYNESAFLHFKIFDDSIKRLIRKNLGDEDFNKVKNDNKQKTSESIFRDNQYEKQLESISFNNKKLISFHKK